MQSLPSFKWNCPLYVLTSGFTTKNHARKTEKTVLKSTVDHKENNSRKEAMLTLRVFLTNHPLCDKLSMITHTQTEQASGKNESCCYLS